MLLKTCYQQTISKITRTVTKLISSILTELFIYTEGVGNESLIAQDFRDFGKNHPNNIPPFPLQKKVGHDKKTLVMLFRAVERLINDLRRPASNAGLLFSFY